MVLRKGRTGYHSRFCCTVFASSCSILLRQVVLQKKQHALEEKSLLESFDVDTSRYFWNLQCSDPARNTVQFTASFDLGCESSSVRFRFETTRSGRRKRFSEYQSSLQHRTSFVVQRHLERSTAIASNDLYHKYTVLALSMCHTGVEGYLTYCGALFSRLDHFSQASRSTAADNGLDQ